MYRGMTFGKFLCICFTDLAGQNVLKLVSPLTFSDSVNRFPTSFFSIIEILLFKYGGSYSPLVIFGYENSEKNDFKSSKRHSCYVLGRKGNRDFTLHYR